jgi:hypothetical protein
MSLRSFHERLIQQDVLLGHLRSAMGIADASAGAVYAGRFPKNARHDLDVCVEWDGEEKIARGGGDQTWEHRARIRVSFKRLPDLAGAGSLQLRDVQRRTAQVIASLDGQRPFYEALPEVKHHRCEATALDENGPDRGRTEVRLTLWSYTQGDGSKWIEGGFGESP